jgi:hypothetical protein
VIAVPTIERSCPSCRDQRLFEQPPCVDGHGVDCTEWCCTECGAAVLIGLAAELAASPAAAAA